MPILRRMPTKHFPPRRCAGVTLVELSVVLTIIALLIGAIIGGVELKQAMELRSIISESQKYEAAIQSFKLRFGYLPGDIPVATDIWGTAPTAAAPETDPDDCADLIWSGTRSEGTRTCNGNGDGKIMTNSEALRLWQHLSNAELVADKYSGVGGPQSSAPWTLEILAGDNFPASSFGQTCWDFAYAVDWIQSMAYQFNGNFDYHYHSLIPGVGLTLSGRGVLTAREMYDFDQKFDDGMPATGQITTLYGGSTAYDDCTVKADGTSPTTSSDTDARYAVDQPSTSIDLRECAFSIRSKL